MIEQGQKYQAFLESVPCNLCGKDDYEIIYPPHYDQAKPEEIAIAATSTQDWDDHVLAYAGNAGLPVQFSHGVPALSRPEGQACAALADVLVISAAGRLDSGAQRVAAG